MKPKFPYLTDILKGVGHETREIKAMKGASLGATDVSFKEFEKELIEQLCKSTGLDRKMLEPIPLSYSRYKKDTERFEWPDVEKN